MDTSEMTTAVGGDAAKAAYGAVSVADVRRVPLAQHAAAEGLLTVAESKRHVPFAVSRCFIVQPSDVGTVRGRHAHRSLTQLLICISGEIEVAVEDGLSTAVHTL